MRYITQAWAAGSLSERRSAAVLRDYNKSLEADDIPVEVRRFATTIGLNTAYIDSLGSNAGTLELKLLTGDLQVGYWRTTLTYLQAHLEGEEVLARAIRQRPTEIWHDEFVGQGSATTHSILLAPKGSRSLRSRGEFHIQFAGFQFSQIPAETRWIDGMPNP